MNIVAATPACALGIATVHIRSWQAGYAHILEPGFLDRLSIERRAERWRDILQRAESPMWVATRDEEVVGFVSFGKCRDEGAPQSQGEVWALYVSPEAWGQGVGRALLDEAVRESQAAGYRVISLWVLSQNQRGLRFYEGCGFSRVVGSEKHFELGGRQVEEVCLKKQNDAPIEVVPHDSTRPLLRADVSH